MTKRKKMGLSKGADFKQIIPLYSYSSMAYKLFSVECTVVDEAFVKLTATPKHFLCIPPTITL